jgi:hypothetical protein
MVTGIVAVAAVVHAAAAATAAPAAGTPTGDRLIAKIVDLNQQALGEIGRRDLTAARKHLLEAEQLAAQPDLATHPLVARTYLHLGVVEVLSGDAQRKADELFRKAVRIQPDIQLTKQLAVRADVHAAVWSDLEKARCTRDASRAWSCPWTEDAGDPDLPARIVALDCRARDAVEKARPVVVRCAADPALRVEQATLFYGAGAPAAKFTPLKMSRNARGWWTASIPAERVTGKSMRFYAEATDAGKQRVASSGDEHRPWLMLVLPRDSCSCESKAPPFEQARLKRP